MSRLDQCHIEGRKKVRRGVYQGAIQVKEDSGTSSFFGHLVSSEGETPHNSV